MEGKPARREQPPVALTPLSVEASTLSERAAESIRAAIDSGHLEPGELYSVAMLADEFGVSRTPVREALLVLERQGMVRFERNRGVRVLETTLQDLSDIFGLRLMLEVPASRQASRCLDDAGIAAVRTELTAMRRAAEIDDEAEFMHHDRSFHGHILAASGNQRLTSMIGNLRSHIRQRGVSTVGRTRSLAVILSEHEAIMEALEARDPDRTAKAMRNHIVSTGQLLIEQQGGTESDMSWVRWADPTNGETPIG